eukprot:12556716-Alexandrium_andersonii.AAC.1
MPFQEPHGRSPRATALLAPHGGPVCTLPAWPSHHLRALVPWSHRTSRIAHNTALAHRHILRLGRP